MTELNEIYKCNVCGNMVEMVHAGAGELVCCGQPMQQMKENIVEASLEKHVPIIEKTDNGFKVKVGSVEHPMEEAHHIEWIEIIVMDAETGKGKAAKKFLKPGEKAEAVFGCGDPNKCCADLNRITARAYCNLHGLWKS
ncbi:MAG: desulfoferrodoxin [Candidatus Woesearchaeota archaeon]